MRTSLSMRFLPALAILMTMSPGQRPARPPAAAAAGDPASTEAVPADPAKITTDQNGFTISAGEITANDLIDAAAKFLGRNILWTPAELAQVQGFTLQRPLAVDAPGCEELLHQLLSTRALVVIPIDEAKNLYEVISSNGPRARDIVSAAVWRTPDEVLRRENLKQVVIVAVPLQHINAQIATNALRPFFAQMGINSPTNLVIGNVGNNALLVQGFADQVADAIRVLREADKPLQDRDPDLATMGQGLQNAQARIAELQAQVQRLQGQVAELHKAFAEKK